MTTRAVLLLDGLTSAHLARALAEHRRWCRANGVPMPVALDDLLAAVAASSGQQGPRVDTDPLVGEPVAVSYGEAARRIGVSERTLRRLVAAGELPATRAGRRRLVPVSALSAYVEG